MMGFALQGVLQGHANCSGDTERVWRNAEISSLSQTAANKSQVHPFWQDPSNRRRCTPDQRHLRARHLQNRLQVAPLQDHLGEGLRQLVLADRRHRPVDVVFDPVVLHLEPL
jgi:hypothetical protein